MGQNIDDILKLLKNSVEKSSSEQSPVDSDMQKSGDGISEEALKAQLKNQYLDGSQAYINESEEQAEESYAIDDEFLVEAVDEETTEEETAEEMIIEEEIIEEAPMEEITIEEEITEEAPIEEELIEEEEESLFEIGESDEDIDLRVENTHTDDLIDSMVSTQVEESIDDIEAEELTEELSEELTEEQFDEIIEDIEDIEENEENEENEEIFGFSFSDDGISEGSLEEALGAEAVSYDGHHADDIEYLADSDIITLREITEQEEIYNAEEQTAMDEAFGEDSVIYHEESIRDYSALDSETEESDAAEEENEVPEEFDDSVFDLMIQMGCYKEAKATLKKTEEEKSELNKGDIEKAHQRAEEKMRFYSDKRKSVIFKLIGSAIICFVLFIYEFFPLFGLNFTGIFDYKEHPFSYALMGLQLVVFSIIIFRKRIWNGLRSVFYGEQTGDSFIALVVCSVVLYDILVIFGVSELPMTFNFILSAILLLSCIDELVSTEIELRACGLIMSEDMKFTLGENSRVCGVAEKMYRGGYDPDRRIYSMNNCEKLSRYTDNIGADKKRLSKLSRALIIPSFVFAAIVSMVSSLLSSSLVGAVGSFMLTLFLTLPLGDIIVSIATHVYVRHTLVKRGTVINIAKSSLACTHGDSMVFSDLHLFKKCNSKNLGIVIYKEGQEDLIIECLAAVYSKLGGPMSELFCDVLKTDELREVRLNRIAKNGVEAFVDRKYTLIVGDASYLQRYGISFPENRDKRQRDGVSTLCVALGGLPAAKISVKYEIEPMFEVMTERLYEVGVKTVVETYDPLINSSFTMTCRSHGSAPISVVHKGMSDYENPTREKYTDNSGMLSCSSRLKLVESVIWCHKLTEARRVSSWTSAAFSALGAVIAILAIALGYLGDFNEFWVLLYSMVSVLSVFAISMRCLPNKQYMSVEGLCKKLQKENKKRNKQSRGQTKTK